MPRSCTSFSSAEEEKSVYTEEFTLLFASAHICAHNTVRDQLDSLGLSHLPLGKPLWRKEKYTGWGGCIRKPLLYKPATVKQFFYPYCAKKQYLCKHSFPSNMCFMFLSVNLLSFSQYEMVTAYLLLNHVVQLLTASTLRKRELAHIPVPME